METKKAEYWGSPKESNLRATHPGFAYYELNTGILLFGRPIRSNFYVYKLPEERARELGAMLDARVDGDERMAFVERHEIKWSQNVSRDGYESARRG